VFLNKVQGRPSPVVLGDGVRASTFRMNLRKMTFPPTPQKGALKDVTRDLDGVFAWRKL